MDAAQLGTDLLTGISNRVREPARDLLDGCSSHGHRANRFRGARYCVSSMKPERIVLLLASLLLAAGFIVWAVGGAAALQGSGIWLWVGALAILSLPLLLWLLDAIVRAVRR